MQSADIITHLQRFLPRRTDQFSSVIRPQSITVDPNDSTQGIFTFAQPHGREANEKVTIVGALVQTEIATIELDDVMDTLTLTTVSTHDLTKDIIKTVRLSGSTNPNLNGVFELLEVPNRQRFVIRFTQTDVSNPGTIFLNEPRSIGNINQAFEITNVTPNTFTISLDHNFPNVDVSSVAVHIAIRISGGGDIDRVLAHYEQLLQNSQPIKQLWAFVILDDVTTSKDRYVNNDATNNQGNLNSWNVQLLSPFSVYVIVPSAEDITARRARDICEVLRPDIYSVLLGQEFPSGFTTDGGSATSPLGDELAGYFESYYVHRFRFEQVVQVCSDDIMYLGEEAANRDMLLQFVDTFNNTDEIKLQTNVNVDDEPQT